MDTDKTPKTKAPTEITIDGVTYTLTPMVDKVPPEPEHPFEKLEIHRKGSSYSFSRDGEYIEEWYWAKNAPSGLQYMIWNLIGVLTGSYIEVEDIADFLEANGVSNRFEVKE